MASSPTPNPLIVAGSVIRALVVIRAPNPRGTGAVDHSGLAAALRELDHRALGRLPDLIEPLSDYLEEMATVDPDELAFGEALAFWLNVYNAAALRLAGAAVVEGADSVLRIPGGFTTPLVSIAGEELSLDAIEHAKLRRFRDPRIHAALVCGSVSCPTLRRRPFGGDVESQLNEQMGRFLVEGALVADRARGSLTLSPMFAWFGGDFTRPHRMPTLLPARRSRVLASLLPYLDDELTTWIESARPKIRFGSYDWRVSCAVG